MSNFYTLEELDERGIDYRYQKWSISVLNTVEIEIEQLYSDESWENVFEFCKGLIGGNFSGEIARQIHIFGDPQNAHKEQREHFKPSSKPWLSQFHFQVC
jgi:hypothetical protein